MPRVDLLAKLLEAVAVQNWRDATGVGAQIATEEDEKGHHSAAQRLRGALDPNGQRARPRTTPDAAVADPGFIASALTLLTGAPRFDEVELRPSLRERVSTIKTEWEHRDALLARHVSRRRRLLFHGPPGCGKSLTACALGAELTLPTYVIRLDAVVGAFLGQTALRIRELFRFAEQQTCVLLLDEIDALGRRRGASSDVGEIDRVVISLMQALEHAEPRGLLVATSNLPKHLDEALFRRFDDVLDFPRPNRVELARFAARRAERAALLSPSAAKRLANGAQSYAEAERRIAAAERSLVLREVAR
jgi:SpoVK/Ycf46/Vps4 family AAA+-type ATPase